jgi:glycosyltransferase involved in cell wall biosynthesis
VAAYFSAADVVVQPYVSATQSGVAKIAYHFERPLIMTDVGGLAEMMPDGEAGLVVPPEDPVALAEAVGRFFEDDLQDRLTDGVRREKEKYAWDPLYEAVERFALDG